jgi:hypothetical protein
VPYGNDGVTTVKIKVAHAILVVQVAAFAPYRLYIPQGVNIKRKHGWKLEIKNLTFVGCLSY